MVTIDWAAVDRMTPEEIENIRVEIVKLIQHLKNERFIVKEEYNSVQKKIIQLQSLKHDLKSSLEKAGHNIAERETDVELLTTKFWNKRR